MFTEVPNSSTPAFAPGDQPKIPSTPSFASEDQKDRIPKIPTPIPVASQSPILVKKTLKDLKIEELKARLKQSSKTNYLLKRKIKRMETRLEKLEKLTKEMKIWAKNYAKMTPV